MRPLVSVRVITYNHEKYIAQCIEASSCNEPIFRSRSSSARIAVQSVPAKLCLMMGKDSLKRHYTSINDIYRRFDAKTAHKYTDMIEQTLKLINKEYRFELMKKSGLA